MDMQAPSLQYFGRKAVISALEQHREGFYHFASHIHSSVEIYEILAGRCSMDINNGTITAGAGDFVMIMPNTLHSFYLCTEDECRFQHIHFRREPLGELFHGEDREQDMDLFSMLIRSNPGCCKVKTTDRLHQLVARLLEDEASPSVYSAAYSNLHLLELVLYLLELTRNSEITPSHGTSQNQYVAFTLSYIGQNYTHKILISSISSSLNISERYLSKIFYQNMHLTIGNYINIYRINQSIECMLHTEMNLTEIAQTNGLNDSQHFSKMFASIMGITPLKYRKLLRESDETEDWRA